MDERELIVEKRRITLPDGRPLIYFTFEEPAASDGPAAPERAGGS